jgi:hypothetical protein
VTSGSVDGSEETEKGTSSLEGLFQRQIGFLNPIGSFRAPTTAVPRPISVPIFPRPTYSSTLKMRSSAVVGSFGRHPPHYAVSDPRRQSPP